MNYTFIWKLTAGPELFEQTVYGDSLAAALEYVLKHHGFQLADCELFGFNTSESLVIVKMATAAYYPKKQTEGISL